MAKALGTDNETVATVFGEILVATLGVRSRADARRRLVELGFDVDESTMDDAATVMADLLWAVLRAHPKAKAHLRKMASVADDADSAGGLAENDLAIATLIVEHQIDPRDALVLHGERNARTADPTTLLQRMTSDRKAGTDPKRLATEIATLAGRARSPDAQRKARARRRAT